MRVLGIALVFSFLVAPQAKQVPEEHITHLIAQLPETSLLREQLVGGAHGDGIHYPWMDLMRSQRVKRAEALVALYFDRKGRPKRAEFLNLNYYDDYEGGQPVSSFSRLVAIKSTSMAADLKTLAVERAKHGFWEDVPSPRPNPFTGRAKVIFYDDEWLPTPMHPEYYLTH